MKNPKIFIVIVILLLITFATLLIIKKPAKEIVLDSTVNPTNEASSIKEGYVILKNNNIYFIQNNNDNDDYQKNLDKVKNKEHPSDSILTSHNPTLLKNIENGDKIKIWIKQVLESYPQKLIIEKYEKVKY